jgi:protein-tyrosine phosphatase
VMSLQRTAIVVVAWCILYVPTMIAYRSSRQSQLVGLFSLP